MASSPCRQRLDCMRPPEHRGDCSRNLAEAARNLIRRRRTDTHRRERWSAPSPSDAAPTPHTKERHG